MASQSRYISLGLVILAGILSVTAYMLSPKESNLADGVPTATYISTDRQYWGLPGYPPAEIVPTMTNIPVTVPSETEALLTQQAMEATLTLVGSVPESTPTATTNEVTVIDSLNGFQVEIPPGWYADLAPQDARQGFTILTNYEPNGVFRLPSAGIMLQIGSFDVPSGMSSEEYMPDILAQSTSPQNRFPADGYVSAIEPLQLRNQRAYAATTETEGHAVDQMFVFFPGDGRLVVAYIVVGEARHYRDYSDGLKILESIQLR